ncbi:hypothetical protein AURDEDRAFT_93216, partial [Auricularia subglabra TFB-10046 SS5]
MTAPFHSPDPNRFAGTIEASFLRDTISADEALLSTLATRVAQSSAAVHAAERELAEVLDKLALTRSVHDMLCDEQTSVSERLRQSRGLVHPIRRLPPEVLAEVFTACLSDEQLHSLSAVPYPVSQVCRRWRSVALQTPRLWTYVSVNFRSPH